MARDQLADVVTGADALDVPATAEIMARAVRNVGRPGLVATAIRAVDLALWDLKARLLGLPLCRLLGRARERVPVYGSGGFTSYDDDRTRSQLEHWTAQGIPRMKIKIGESWGSAVERDLHRVALARRVIGPDAELYVDANGGYTRGQARRVAARLAEHDVTWFEEPVSSDDLTGLAQLRQQCAAGVAAGEYGYDLPYVRRMLDAQAVDCLRVDVTRIGGTASTSTTTYGSSSCCSTASRSRSGEPSSRTPATPGSVSNFARPMASRTAAGERPCGPVNCPNPGTSSARALRPPLRRTRGVRPAAVSGTGRAWPPGLR